jgi:Protein of unknown function (DUF2946)
MQSLRNALILARLVLAWFVLFIGIAVASPVVKPQALELICSGAGVVKLLDKSDDTGGPHTGHGLDCPLCVSLDAPVTLSQDFWAAAPSHVSHPAAATRVAVLAAAAPLPARGPPLSLSI